MREGWGEYDFYGEQAVAVARDYFLQEVRRLKPKVLEELRNDPFNRYLEARICDPPKTAASILPYDYGVRELWNKLSSGDFSPIPKIESIRPVTGENDEFSSATAHESQVFDLGTAPTQDARLKALWVSLKKWACENYLDADWCIYSALSTLNLWSRSKEDLDKMNWGKGPILFFLFFSSRRSP